jgi:hypothetical protein
MLPLKDKFAGVPGIHVLGSDLMEMVKVPGQIIFQNYGHFCGVYDTFILLYLHQLNYML